MTDIVPVPNWGGVRQLETNEYATGGLNGNMNEQAKSLAGQNMYSRLYAGLPFDPVFTAQVGGFPIGGRAALENGDIVRSAIPSNVNNPNENMTGWVKTNAASQIFDDSGKTQQDINNDTTRYLSVNFSEIQSLLPSTITKSFIALDRGYARFDRVPVGTPALPASGNGKWWTTDSLGGRWWISSELTTEALGAVIDGTTNTLTVIKELVEVAAPYFNRPAYISEGVHAILRTTAADAIYVKSGTRVVFDIGAKIKGSLNLSGYYVPFFAIVDKYNVVIEGASDKQFIFTNRLTYGIGQDFITSDPSFTPNVVVDKRLGSTGDVYASTYASGVAVISSSFVRITGLGCQSVDGSAWVAGAAVCHGFISSSGNCNNFYYDGIDADDVVLGVLVQGGDNGYGGRVRTGRMSQDVGIPGHTRYDFRRSIDFGDTVDDGIETGADLTKSIGHTVSYAGSGRVTFGNIVSARRHGPLNIKNCNFGAVFNGIYWRPVDLRAGMSADILPEQPRMYFVTSSNNALIHISDAIIDCRNADVVGIGGDAGAGSNINATIVRDNSAASTYGFIAPRGSNQEWNLTLRQVSTTPVDPAKSVMCTGSANDNVFRLTLDGFVAKAPTVEVLNGSNNITRCSFIINNQYNTSGGSTHASFGDPLAVWIGTADDSALARNWMSYPDGVSPWDKPVPAGTTYSVKFPLPVGSAIADICIQSNLYSSGTYFERLESFIIRAVRPSGRGGAFATAATSLGAVAGINNNSYSITLTPAASVCTVSGAITGASPQGATSRVFYTLSKLSSSS